ncbi:2-hydroxyacid dehydrogenase [Frigidibacter sp. ROC022]|uniref:2-hydroxyacid dehydrogenase n=1 Tax=Frigidibacter sp. ROC022 TaxID=2971796 RepID=UPI00215B7588|nr:2-hydroxyacid dehydrogenase [Frigidibacter sp. ROC022]MCR8725662.1 2-hydroxyacid dehydrogenase [Frigidibacter sp. ROC022]
MPRVAVLETVDDALAAAVRAAAGPDLDLRSAAGLDAEGLAAALKGATYAVVRGARLTPELLDGAPDIRMIHAWGTGLNCIPLEAAQARGITVARSPGLNAPSVADLTLGLMLAVLRRIPAADARLRQGTWKMDALWEGARDLSELRVGLVGVGAIGQAVARRLRGFGCDIAYTRPSGPLDGQPGWLPLEGLLESVDILSLHLPLNAATRQLLGAAEFARMRRGAVLINTSRGGLVDQAAMIEALVSGQLGGLGLDVFDPEPPAPDNPLLSLPNTVLTPHVGGRTEDNLTRMVGNWARNIRAHHAGQPIPASDIVFSG